MGEGGGPNPRGEIKPASGFGPGEPDPLADLDRGDQIRGDTGMSLSARTTAVEFEVAFAILQFCIRAIRKVMAVQPRSDIFRPPL